MSTPLCPGMVYHPCAVGGLVLLAFAKRLPAQKPRPWRYVAEVASPLENCQHQHLEQINIMSVKISRVTGQITINDGGSFLRQGKLRN
jgi:hypothetical protein